MVHRINLFHQRPAEFVNAVQPLLDVRQAGGVAQADVIVRAERDAGHGGDLFLLQQFRAEVGGLEAGPGNVREQIKRALGVHAGEAGDGVQFLMRVAAALVVFR